MSAETYTAHPTESVEAEYAERTQDIVGAPVAVQVVDAAPLRTRRQPTHQFTTGSVNLNPTDPAMRIVGDNPFRDRLHVRVGTGGTVYIGAAAETLTPGGGYRMPAASELDIYSRRDVWVIPDPTNSGAVAISFLAEHVDG